MDTSTAVAAYLAENYYRGLSLNTLKAQRWALRRLESHCPTLPTHGRQLLPVAGDRNLSAASRKDIRKELKTFFGWCARQYDWPDVIATMPKPPRETRTLPRVLALAELQALSNAADTPRDQALLAFPLDTGARLGEIANLRRPSLLGTHVRLDGKTGPRQVPISPELLELLTTLGEGPAIWTGQRGPLSIHGVQSAYQRLFTRAGVTGPKTDGPHVLRHTFATHYIAQGGNVVHLQAILGHSKLETTMVYVHLASRDIAQDHARFSPLRTLQLTR